MLVNGRTESGFKYQIQKEQVEDYEFIELIGEADNNPALFPKIMKKLLGNEQLNELKEHLRTESGFVPVPKMIDEFQEIMNNPKLKN